MPSNELRTFGSQLLREAAGVWALFPYVEAMRCVPIPPFPEAAVNARGPVRSALTYLRDEVLLVQSGRTNTLVVLSDEMANVIQVLDLGESCSTILSPELAEVVVPAAGVSRS